LFSTRRLVLTYTQPYDKNKLGVRKRKEKRQITPERGIFLFFVFFNNKKRVYIMSNSSDNKIKSGYLLADVDLYTNIVISITNLCNLSCGYCIRGSGPIIKEFLSFKTVKNILNFIKSRNSGNRQILQLTGGEVFLHKDIFNIIKYALSLGFLVRIQTNGILLPSLKQNELELLSDKNIVLKISLDGWDEETHEFYRGKKTFKKVLRGLICIRKITSQIGLKTVIHEKNFSKIHKMLDLCLSLNIKSWSHNILKQGGRCLNKNTITELDVLEKLIPYYNKTKYRKMLGGSNVLIYYLLNYQRLNSLPIYYFVHSNGNVYLTDNVTDKNKVGSVKEDFKKLFCLKNSEIIPSRRVDSKILEYVESKLLI